MSLQEPNDPTRDVTLLIGQARGGDRRAFDRIFELLYPELRQIARHRLRRSAPDGASDTVWLVHECYLKFARSKAPSPTDRAHFLAYSSTVMRSIVVDAARTAASHRRGGDSPPATLDTALLESLQDPADEILDVHAALEELARFDPRLAQVVEMRYFGGMDDSEIAAVLGISTRTVGRDWEKARLLLAQALRA